MRSLSVLVFAFLWLAAPHHTFADEAQCTERIWGWFRFDARARYDVMEKIMGSLSGEQYAIHYVYLDPGDAPVPMFSLPPRAMKVMEGIAKEYPRGPRRGKRKKDAVIHFVLWEQEADVVTTLRLLDQAGFLGYVYKNIDLFSLDGGVMRCPVRPAQCLGGSRCDFIKAVTLSIPGGIQDAVEMASLLVHEAGHLERCYDDEDYAVSQEGSFVSALKGYHPRMDVHGGAFRAEPVPLEDFSPAFVITPRRIRRTS